MAAATVMSDDVYVLLVVGLVGAAWLATLALVVIHWIADRRAAREQLTRDQLHRTVAEARGREPVR